MGTDQPQQSKGQVLKRQRVVGDVGAMSVVLSNCGQRGNLGKDSSFLSEVPVSLGAHMSVQPLGSPELRGGGKRENRGWLYVSRSFPPSSTGVG